MSANWGPDPARRHEYRWWDGQAWTGYVMDGGRPGWDPVDTTGPRHANPGQGYGQQGYGTPGFPTPGFPTPGFPTPGSPAGSHPPGRPTASTAAATAPRPTASGPFLTPGRHVLLTACTLGLWVLILPSVLWWRRGHRQAAGLWATALVVLGLITSTHGAGPEPGQPATAGYRPLVAGASAPSTSAVLPPTPTTHPTTHPTTRPAPPTKPKVTTPAVRTRTTPRSTTPVPRPTSTSPGLVQGVHPGAFCNDYNGYGVTAKGTLMRCTQTAADPWYRWRRA